MQYYWTKSNQCFTSTFLDVVSATVDTVYFQAVALKSMNPSVSNVSVTGTKASTYGGVVVGTGVGT